MGSHPRPPAAVRTAAARWTALVAVLVLIAGAACSKSHRQLLFTENLLPTVTVTSSQVDTSRSHPDTWRVTIVWQANDGDGVVDHVEYAIDPASSETTWVSTQTDPLLLEFPVKHREPNGSITPEYHVFVLRARDDRNEVSPVLAQAFYAGDIPPSVHVVTPAPNALLNALVPPDFTVSWAGDDPDGFPTHRPDHYLVRTLAEADPKFVLYHNNPDSLMRAGIESGFAEWTRYGGDTTSIVVHGFALGSHGLFAVIAVDGQGVPSPQLSLDTNMFAFQVTGDLPFAHFQSAYFDFTVAGGLVADPSLLRPVELPGGAPIVLSWNVQPLPGSLIKSTRWVLDPIDMSDTTTRVDPTDVHHWSAGAFTLPGSALLGPFADAGSAHRFWLEIEDDQHRLTLTGLRFVIVQPAFDHDLLVVDDTRREADKYLPAGCPAPYTRPWPSAAELDTFLYARGGVPWRCLPNGVVASSVPGLLAGYAFDTTGTRRGLEDPSQAVTLATLAHYRHVLWLTDQSAALNSSAGNDFLAPITALRAMSQPAHIDVLINYVHMGGQVWLAGGGCAYATLVTFDVSSNNSGASAVFDSDHQELVAGRLLYDAGHLRSSIACAHAGGVQLTRSAAARGGWSGHGPYGTLSAPDYTRLPAELRLRTPATDPIPPTRTAGQASSYYPTGSDYEVVASANAIVEDMDPDPEVVHIESTLDTLVEASGLTLLTSPAPAMTYYHGRDNTPFLFSGFDLWSWSRADAQAFVDFVLGDVWGLSKAGQRAAGAPAGIGGGASRRPGTRGTGWHRLDPLRARP